MNQVHQVKFLEPPAEDDGLDLAQMRELARFVLGAPRRHLALSLTAFALTLGVAIAAAIHLPRTWHVETRILAQRNLVMPSLVNPRRMVPRETDAPTQSAAESILKHDSIVALVKQTNLLDRWHQSRPALLRAKDDVVEAFLGTPTDEERMRALVGMLQKRLTARVDKSTIIITLDWHDPVVARELVMLAQANFVEERRAAEVAVITDTIAILEEEVDKEGKAMATALAELTKVRDAAEPKAAPAEGTTPQVAAKATPSKPAVVWKAAPADPSSGLAAALAAKRKAIKELDEPRQKLLATLRVELTNQRAKYGPAHPTIIELERKIADASVDPPELAKLRAEEAALRASTVEIPAEYDVAPAPKPVPIAAPTPQPVMVPQPVAASPMPLIISSTRDDPPQVVAARNALDVATRRYTDVLDRVESARIEMHTVEAAFKNRYTVVQPAEVPDKPRKPSVPMILTAGLFSSVALAFIVAYGRDVSTGRFIDRSQVRRRLRIPLLSDVGVP